MWAWVLLMIIAAALCLAHVTDRTIWEDEAWTLHVARQPDPTTIMDFVREDSFPPLYFFLLHGWQWLAGDTLVVSRMVNVWAVLLGTALTFRLTLDMANLRAAFAVTIVLITSDIVLAFVPFARQYGFFVLLAALATWCYWRFTSHWSWRWTAAYILAADALLYTIYWGGFVLIAHGLHALIFHRKRLPRLGLVFVAIALLFAPCLPLFVEQATGGSFGVGETGGYVHGLPLNSTGLKVIIFQFFGVPETLFVGLALAGLAGTWAPSRWQDRLPSRSTALAGLWLSVPIVLPILITAAGYKLLTYRPMVGLVPALAILIGGVLAKMPRWVYSVLLAIIVVNNAVTTGAAFPTHGPWWSDPTEVLATNMSPQDVLYIESDFMTYSIEEHARQAHLPYHAIIRGGPIRSDWAGETGEPVLDRLAQVDSLWLVEYRETRDVWPDLANLGFVPTTPTMDFGTFIGSSVRLTRFARLPDHLLPWTFGTELQLSGIDWWQTDDALHVDMTWLALAQPSLDYTVLTFLMGADGRLVTQRDSYPLSGRSPTTTWTANSWHFDRHNLDLSHVPPGEYRLGVRIYTWWDLAIQPVTPCDAELCEHVFVGTIHVPAH